MPATSFSQDDADTLREQQPYLAVDTADALDSAPDALGRYFRHYGFASPLAAHGRHYELRFRHWSGFDVATHHWQVVRPRGTVCVVHGLLDHVGLYLKLVGRLLDEGYNVAMLELPGHGLSSGKPIAIAEFSVYGDVLKDWLAQVQQVSAGPLFAVGQSTGCSAIMQYLFQTEGAETVPLARLVFLAPLVRAHRWHWIVAAHTLARRLLRRVRRGFTGNSNDTAFTRFLKHDDPLQSLFIDVSWVTALRQWVGSFDCMPVRPAPLLVIQGTGDVTVDWRWNLPRIERHFPNTHSHYVEGAMHHLVNEAKPWRTEVFDTLCEFLRDQ